MRLIDADNIGDSDIANALGTEYCSCLPDIRELLDEQPTIKPQCIATINVDFTKEDINKLVEEKVKESLRIGWNLDKLKELLMEYSYVKNKAFLYDEKTDGVILDEETIDDIIRFIEERENIYV